MIRSAWTTSSQGFKNSPSGCSMSIGRSCFLSCKAIGGECGSTPTPLFRSPTLTSEVNKEEAATEKQQPVDLTLYFAEDVLTAEGTIAGGSARAEGLACREGRGSHAPI